MSANRNLITRSIVSSDDPAGPRPRQSRRLRNPERPPELATATSATDPVLRHAVNPSPSPSSVSSESSTTSVRNPFPHAVVMLYGNIPIRQNQMIDRCIQMLLETNCDSVQTIAPVGRNSTPTGCSTSTPTTKSKSTSPTTSSAARTSRPLFPTGAVYVMKTSGPHGRRRQPPTPTPSSAQTAAASSSAPKIPSTSTRRKDLYIAEAMLRASRKNTAPKNIVRSALPATIMHSRVA